jgi:Dyp-type peroxidase family
MSDSEPILEAPAPGPLSGLTVDQSNRPDKNLRLDVDQIQGNIFPGFLKDSQTLLFLRITDRAAFAKWLERLIPRIATMETVVAFNRLHKHIRYKHKSETLAPKITWINMAFSFAGLQELHPWNDNLDEFVDQAFKAGLLKRAQGGQPGDPPGGWLGDPVGTGTLGDPINWVVGGPGNEAHVVLIVAGDCRSDVDQEVAWLQSTIFPSSDAAGRRSTSGAEVIFQQDGATLMGPLRGHEHFGFRDGISQPGIRGTLPDGTFLTPNQNPDNPNEGKPGEILLWPGEFVFGYPGQDWERNVEEQGVDPLQNPNRQAPEFARNGSFLVFRRLRQDVGTFHRFLQETAAKYSVTPELLAARMVGRWPSGAPAVLSPDKDDPELANDDLQNNHFDFAEKDSNGVAVPFACHIRKIYPRNDASADAPSLGVGTAQIRRLLRRGIPYGKQSRSTPHQPVDDDVDRGLLFLAHVASIVDQFEFVINGWVNKSDFKQKGVGHDPIIGQNAGPHRSRFFNLNLRDGPTRIDIHEEWVVPTGGGYFFAPSILALQVLAGMPMPAPENPAT